MGLGIGYRIRLANKDAAVSFIAAARAEARKLGWKILGSPKRPHAAEFAPYSKSEPVHLDFSESLVCDEYTKTSFAPERIHIQLVEFLRALKPHAKSMRLDDECEYWSTGDRALLKEHRATLSKALGTSRRGKATPSPKITYGAISITPDKTGKLIVRIKPGTNISAKELAAMRRTGYVVKTPRSR